MWERQMLTELGQKIILKNKIIHRVEYIDDCKRIKEILYDAGYDLTLEEVEELWRDVSEEACAGWLSADDPEMIKGWLGLPTKIEDPLYADDIEDDDK